MRPRRLHPAPIARSTFARFYFPPDIIVLAVRWYLRFNLSYRDLEELLAERGIEVDHTTIYRWVQRFTPLLADAARPCRHAVGVRWQVDETYVKVAGQWRYVYRAIDQFGQVIDVFVSPRRDVSAARRFFRQAIATTKVTPTEFVTDKAATYPIVLDELLPAAWHRTEQHANNHIEADHGRLKARLRPMRGLKQDRSARIIIAGHALVQNLRRGHNYNSEWGRESNVSGTVTHCSPTYTTCEFRFRLGTAERNSERSALPALPPFQFEGSGTGRPRWHLPLRTSLVAAFRNSSHNGRSVTGSQS